MNRRIMLKTAAFLLLVFGIGFLLYIPVRQIMIDKLIGTPSQHQQYAGILSIPSQSILLPCIDIDCAKDDPSFAQQVVDATNCGARLCYKIGVHQYWVIGDHNYQGFSKIKNCKLGETVSFRNVDGSVLNYRVADLCVGYVSDVDFFRNNGERLLSNANAPQYMLLMTCSPDEVSSAPVKDRRFFVTLELIS